MTVIMGRALELIAKQGALLTGSANIFERPQ
jgi:hypothetical protein